MIFCAVDGPDTGERVELLGGRGVQVDRRGRATERGDCSRGPPQLQPAGAQQAPERAPALRRRAAPPGSRGANRRASSRRPHARVHRRPASPEAVDRAQAVRTAPATSTTSTGAAGTAGGRPGAAETASNHAPSTVTRAGPGLPPDEVRRAEDDSERNARSKKRATTCERECGHARSVPANPSRVCHDSAPNLNQFIHRERGSDRARYTTRLTSLSGTTNARGSCPFRNPCTFSDACATRDRAPPPRGPAGT